MGQVLKIIKVINFAFIFSILALASANAQEFSAHLSDEIWDGQKIPDGMQCLKFGGVAPHSPLLAISGIPPGANVLVLEFSDRDSEKMNNGGHGKIGYTLSTKASSVKIGSIAGHSFELPEGFFMVEAHQGPNWDKAGAYMPPCSGGKSHFYYITIRAIKYQSGQQYKELGSTVVDMGKY